MSTRQHSARPGAALGTLVAHVLTELKSMGQLPPALASTQVQAALTSGAELPTDCFAQLYRTATATLTAQLAKSGEHPPFSALDTELLCRCLLSCDNLEDAILRAADFCRAIAPRGGELALQRTATGALFQAGFADSATNPAAQLVELTSLFGYQQLFGWLIGEPLRINSVVLTHSDRDSAAPFLRLFEAPATLAQARAGFEFDAAQLQRPVVRRPPELGALLTAYPFHILGHSGGTLTTAQQVRAFINAALVQQQPLPGSAEIAATLDISDATLRRRLREENTSYLALRESSLLEAAEYHLRNTDRNIEQISSFLGFSDSTAFRRAFHRWTGRAPSALRRETKPKSAA